MSLTVYHTPRRSKSRATLELLQQHTIVQYLESPPQAVLDILPEH